MYHGVHITCILCQAAKSDNLKKIPTCDTVRKILMGQVQTLYCINLRCVTGLTIAALVFTCSLEFIF